MNSDRRLVAGLVLTSLLLAGAGPGDESRRTWTFDDEPAGAIARGFTGAVGKWVVVASDAGKALEQQAKSSDDTFNVALNDEIQARDVDLSVRLRAIAGALDQGGGLIWRARDARNYYIARYNPLEDNFRVYKVEGGKRTQLQSAEIRHSGGWHTLRVTMSGDHIVCRYDGKTYLDVHDATFAEAGKIGLWSKADARSQFDDLSLVGR